MIIHVSDRRRAGITLIEAMAVMFGLAAALTMGATLLLAAMRADRVAAGNLRELARRSELADQFRADVARSSSAPAHVGGWTANESCVILQAVDNSYCVYQWQNGQLERIEHVGDRETRHPIPVGSEFLRVAFERTAANRPTITLRLTEAPPVGLARTTAVTASLGGDLR